MRFLPRATPDKLAAAGKTDRLVKSLRSRERDFVELPSGEIVDLKSQRRVSAAGHLAEVPGERVTAALMELLGDRSAPVRMAALRGLSRRPGDHDAEMMARILDWPDAGQRADAADALADRAEGDRAAAIRMFDAYGDSTSHDRLTLPDRWLTRLFACLPEQQKHESLERALQRVLDADSNARARHVVAADPSRSVRLLAARLQDDADVVPAIQLLGELRDVSATPTLLRMLDAETPARREAAARALGQLRDPVGVEGLLRHAADEDFGVRDAAQRALDQLGTAGVVWSVAAAARGAIANVRSLEAERGRAVEIGPAPAEGD